MTTRHKSHNYSGGSMKTTVSQKISNASTALIAGGLLALSVAMIAGSTPLGIVGWFIFGQLGAGSLTKLVCMSYDVFKGPVGDAVAKVTATADEKNNAKPEAQTA
jgi:hypothetical protein